MKHQSIETRRRGDLLSVSGAALAGAAVGAWWARTLTPLAPLLLFVGLAVHAVGMTMRHQFDRRAEGPLPRGWQWLYLACWIAIGIVIAVVIVAGLRA